MVLNRDSSQPFNYQFNSCLIKFSDNTPNTDLYDFTNTAHYTNIIRNENPNFYDIAANKLFIDETSAAYQKANDAYVLPKDIRNLDRTLPADLGAYKAAPFPE
jgi:hypothetical protein